MGYCVVIDFQGMKNEKFERGERLEVKIHISLYADNPQTTVNNGVIV
jgi:hypothetical protein